MAVDQQFIIQLYLLQVEIFMVAVSLNRIYNLGDTQTNTATSLIIIIKNNAFNKTSLFSHSSLLFISNLYVLIIYFKNNTHIDHTLSITFGRYWTTMRNIAHSGPQCYGDRLVYNFFF